MRALEPKQIFLAARDIAQPGGPHTRGKTKGKYHPDPKGKKRGGLSFIQCVLCMRTSPEDALLSKAALFSKAALLSKAALWNTFAE